MKPSASTARVLAMILGFALLLPACTSTEANPSDGHSAVSGPARDLVAIWILDEAATLDRARAHWTRTEGKPPDPETLEALQKELKGLDTQVGLNANGTFILKNRKQDDRGVVTIEGNWCFRDGVVILEGLRESGRPVANPRRVHYALRDSRLHRDATEKGTIHPVLKKGFGW